MLNRAAEARHKATAYVLTMLKYKIGACNIALHYLRMVERDEEARDEWRNKESARVCLKAISECFNVTWATLPVPMVLPKDDPQCMVTAVSRYEVRLSSTMGRVSNIL